MTREEKIRQEIIKYAYSGEPILHKSFSPNEKQMDILNKSLLERFMSTIWNKFDFPIKYRIKDKTIELQHKNTDGKYEDDVYESWASLINNMLIGPFLRENNMMYEVEELHGKWKPEE